MLFAHPEKEVRPMSGAPVPCLHEASLYLARYVNATLISQLLGTYLGLHRLFYCM